MIMADDNKPATAPPQAQAGHPLPPPVSPQKETPPAATAAMAQQAKAAQAVLGDDGVQKPNTLRPTQFALGMRRWRTPKAESDEEIVSLAQRGLYMPTVEENTFARDRAMERIQKRLDDEAAADQKQRDADAKAEAKAA
jgi:hypothetical protein